MPRVTVLVRAFVSIASSWIALASPSALAAQDAQAATGDETELAPIEPEPIDASEIGRRIEETFRELTDVAPALRRQREVLGVRRGLPRFRDEVALHAAQPALSRLNALSSRRLLDLEQDWERIGNRLETWQSILEARGSSLAEERHHIARTRALWMLTRDAPREEPLPPSQLARIDRLLEQIDRVSQRLARRHDEVLDIQGELSDQGIRIAAVIARIQSARQRAREERVRADHEPLWLGGKALRAARLEPPPEQLLEEHGISLRAFVMREKARLAWHLGVLVALAILFVLARARFGAVRSRGARSLPLRAVRTRPLASACLLALVATPFVYRYVPSIVLGLALLGAIPPVLRLGRALVPEPRAPLLALVALSGVSVVLAAGYAPAPGLRIGLLLVACAGTVLALQLARSIRRIPQRATDDRWARRLHVLGASAGVPLAMAAYFDVVGQVERASLLADATFSVLELAVVLYCAVGLVSALLAHVTRHRNARIFLTIRDRRRDTMRVLGAVARWGAVLLLAYSALVAFDVLDPLAEQARLAARQSYQFGSIELSLGDVLAFGAVIAGTVIVVRLVHFLLAQEILPRFGLGQGTEAAISLTVSYCLVALGVVLAFGKAGVDPERLALLGGALGVGIGFGLQNVVSNFVSGLILVAERPMKVGDIIEIGALVGQVKRIGIRSSTVHSLDGAEVIVPNAELISGQLVNWTLSDARRRVELTVGTGYAHDPREVKAILEKVARTQPGVLSDPRPDVLCTGLGESSIDFAIRVWTPDFGSGSRVRSELAQRVYAALGEAGIEIPFPQRDLHVRSIDPAVVALAQPKEA